MTGMRQCTASGRAQLTGVEPDGNVGDDPVLPCKERQRSALEGWIKNVYQPSGFQNLLYEHPAFPKELLARIEAWCRENAAEERKPGQTDEQFVYTTRKKAIGPFKRELWDLDTKDEILAAQRRKVAFLFTELAVNGSREMVERYVHPVELHRPLPESLRSAVAAG